MSILNRSKEAQEKYWSDRALRIIEAAEKAAEEITAGQIDAWENAYRSLTREIEAFYGRYARETGLPVEEIQRRLSPAQLKTAKQDIARYYDETEKLGFDPGYKAYLRSLSARAYMSRLEELKVNIRHEVERLAAAQQEAFHEGLSRTYEESYLRTAFSIHQGLGVGGSFTALSAESIERAVRQKWLGENYSDRIWANKDKLVRNLETIIPRGMALGQNPRVIARDLRAAMGTSRYNAERLARTEFNHIANDATLQGYRNSGVEKYEILAAMDLRTSEICRKMDGKRFRVEDATVGVNYPVFHPNCRTTTIPYFPPDEIDAMFEEEGRIPESMTYEEWRKSLTEEQEKALVADQKKARNHDADKAQLAKYRLIFEEEFPQTLEAFQEMKYSDTERWNDYKTRKQAALNALDYRASFDGKFGDSEVRHWYVAHNTNLSNRIDTSKTLELQAKQAYALRSAYKKQARAMMADRDAAKRLDSDEPIKAFDTFLAEKMTDKGIDKEAAYRDTIESARKTRASVNKKFGIGG